MRYFIDTEFIEKPCIIDLISIGIVAEDNRELYLESSEVDLTNVDPWLGANVLPHLTGRGVPKKTIAQAILDFVGKDTEPQFWAYYADYDWVAFCWLFGRMIDLPDHFPKYCKDFKQTMDDYNIKRKDLPSRPTTEHHALADARWLKESWEWFMCGGASR